MNQFLEPYNPTWKTEFNHLRQVLDSALHPLRSKFEIQHIGSTAVEGLCAKPVLDIDIIISQNELLPDITNLLQHIGYNSRGDQGIEGRFAFRQISKTTPTTEPTRDWQPHHLYLCFADSLAVKNHLLFRDKLRSDKHLMVSYAAIKTSLVNEPGITKEAYAKRKTDFIVAVLANAGLGEKELRLIRDANA